MRRLFVTAVSAMTLSLAGCGFSAQADSDPKVDRSYQVAGFTGLEVAGPYDVTVHTGGVPGVHANGSEKALDAMKVEVKDGRLQISTVPRRGFSLGWHSGPVSLVVTVPMLDSARIAGSGGINVDKVSVASFRGEIAGSGDLKFASVDAGDVRLSIAGSGGVHAAGKAKSVKYEIAGSGDIDAVSLKAETADISIAGSGNIKGHATANASIEMMGSGDIALTGGAKCTISKHGSGDIRCS
jgi:hypothetical protein